MLDPIGDDLDGQLFRAADGLFARRAIGHDPGQFERLRNPAAILFAIEFNGKIHPSSISPTGPPSTLAASRLGFMSL